MNKRDRRVVLGYVPTRAVAFSREKALQNKVEVKKQLVKWGIELIDLAGINEEELLLDPKDVPAVIKKLREHDVDAVFAPHCNFGMEVSVAMVAKEMNKPFLLWSPLEEPPDEKGRRLTDSFCGMLATTRSLVTMGIPFSYIHNCQIQDPMFEKLVKNFIRTVAVVRTFGNLRIGQIGVRPDYFWSVKINERELQEKFGIVVEPVAMPLILEEVKKLVKSNSVALDKKFKNYKDRANFVDNATEEQIKTMAALHLAIENWAEEKEVDATAFQCWGVMQDIINIHPCFVAGSMCDEGKPLICEVDVHGAITAAMVRAASDWKKPISFGDWTVRHPTNKNAVLLWHCGPFPPSLAKKTGKVEVSKAFVVPTPVGTGNFELKAGDISVARFDGHAGQYSLFFGQGHTCEGPYNRGTYVWLEVPNWPRWEEKIVYGPYIHHAAIVHEHVSTILYEACRYIPGLEPDPTEPTVEQLKNWFRGEVDKV